MSKSLMQIELDISGNLLKEVVKELSGLKFLKKLNLSYNDIEEMWPIPSKIETLVISHNKLRKIWMNSETLTNLKILDISFNKISDCDGLQYLSKVQILNVPNNEISTLNHFSNLLSMKECDLRFNKIVSWESMKALCNLKSLKIVMLEGNKM